MNLLNLVPAWSTCQRANLPKAYQLLIFTCERGNKCAKGVHYSTWCANVARACKFFNLECQRANKGVNFLTSPAKRRINFSTNFQKNLWIFQSGWTFANLKTNLAILENLSRETKNLNFDICKFHWGKTLST